MERIKAFFETTQTYLREVLGELRKVTWPGRERTAKLTGIVIGMVALVGVYLFVLDMPLNLALEKLVLGR